MTYSVIVTGVLIAFVIYHWIETVRRDEKDRNTNGLRERLIEIKERHYREEIAALESEIRELKAELPRRCKYCGKYIKEGELCDKCFHKMTGIPEGGGE